MWENIAKLISTVMIWIMMAGIVITIAIASPNTLDGGDVTGLASAMMGIAMVSTLIIWAVPELIRRQNTTRQDAAKYVEIDKQKRTGAGGREDSRMALLMDMMDDDEREAFKQVLKQKILDDMSQPTGDDGELFERDSLYDLMQDDEKRLRG